MNEIAINKNKLEEENLKLREVLKMYQNQFQVVMVFLFHDDRGINVGELITEEYRLKSCTEMTI